MLVYGECECFVMQVLYVCVLCASCGSSQCCVLHDLQFVKRSVGFTTKGGNNYLKLDSSHTINV